MLKGNPIDLAFVDIGENRHIAFNDPSVADFSDEKWVKVVELDEDCLNEQVREGWLLITEDVPKRAITFTVSVIMRCKKIFSVVLSKSS